MESLGKQKPTTTHMSHWLPACDDTVPRSELTPFGARIGEGIVSGNAQAGWLKGLEGG